MQLRAKDDLVRLVAALKTTDSIVNVSYHKPTVAELFSTIHHSSDNLIYFFLYSVSL